MGIERAPSSRSGWPFAANVGRAVAERRTRRVTPLLLPAVLLCLSACSGTEGDVAVCVNCKARPGEGDRTGGLTVVVTKSFGFPLEDPQARPRNRPADVDLYRDVPSRLSETGLFSDVPSLTADPALIEYGLNQPIHNEGARVRNWFALPTPRAVRFHPTGPWGLPVGSTAVQHFELDLATGARQHMETRVMVLTHAGWRGYSYAWQPHQLDATLLRQSRSVTVYMLDATQPTGQRIVEWHYPSTTDCEQCHNTKTGWILGLRTRQVNRNFRYGEVIENQLQAFNRIGVFDRDIGAHTMYDAL